MLLGRLLLLAFLIATSPLLSVGVDDAKGYNKNSSLQWAWAMDALEKYPWTETERVLDIGCGDGKVTAFISKECTNGVVVGLDISPSMIDFASSVFRKQHFSNLIYHIGDIANLPYKGQFDLVVAFCSLHYVTEQEKALTGIYESLCPGGSLVFVGPGHDATCVGNICEELARSPKWAPYFPTFKKQKVYYTQETYTALLENAGFEVVYFDNIYDKVRYANKQALIDWLRPITTCISPLSEPLQNAFLEDVATCMIEARIPSQDEEIVLESSLFECHARRSS